MQKQAANGQEPKVVFRNTNKQQYQSFEKTFHTKEQLQTYLVDKIATNKNKRFNLRVTLT